MNTSPHIINVSMEDFQAAVVEKSKQVPVLLEFYADEAQPSRELTPVLMRLAESFQGKFILARVNIAENQPLVQQLGIRTLPTLKLIVNGQVAKDLEGPQDESNLRELLEQLTQSSMDRVRDQIKMLVAAGDREQAITLLQQVIAEEPKNYGLHTELCDLLIMVGRTDEARQILAALPQDAEGIAKPTNRLEFLELAADIGSMEALIEKATTEVGNTQARFDLAIGQIVEDAIEAALENLLAILQEDREFGDDLARLTMIKVFELLGKGDPLAAQYRRRMFNAMH
jgi:putative thioredoxin